MYRNCFIEFDSLHNLDFISFNFSGRQTILLLKIKQLEIVLKEFYLDKEYIYIV